MAGIAAAALVCAILGVSGAEASSPSTDALRGLKAVSIEVRPGVVSGFVTPHSDISEEARRLFHLGPTSPEVPDWQAVFEEAEWVTREEVLMRDTKLMGIDVSPGKSVPRLTFTVDAVVNAQEPNALPSPKPEPITLCTRLELWEGVEVKRPPHALITAPTWHAGVQCGNAPTHWDRFRFVRTAQQKQFQEFQKAHREANRTDRQ